jgi:hypothetical protein
MNRLLFLLFMITLSMHNAFSMEDENYEPSSQQAPEGKEVYISINPQVNIMDEQKNQLDDQNITGHGQAK